MWKLPTAAPAVSGLLPDSIAVRDGKMLGFEVRSASLTAGELAASVLNNPEQQHPWRYFSLLGPMITGDTQRWLLWYTPTAGAAMVEDPDICLAAASMIPCLRNSSCFSGVVCS